MICPDCEQEVDKVMKSTGTCKKCYCRMQNMKYHKQTYVPLKDMKGTPVYNRLMKRRGTKNNIKSNIETKSTPKINVIKTEITSIEGYEYININSTKILDTINYLKSCLDNVPKMEEQVTKMQEEMLLITHQKAETDGPGDPKFEQLNSREYAIIKYRRQIKDALVYLRQINTNILNDNLINDLDETQQIYEKDEYVPKYARGDVKQYNVSVNVGRSAWF